MEGNNEKTRKRIVTSGILRYTQIYSGILRYTQLYSGILTVYYSGILNKQDQLVDGISKKYNNRTSYFQYIT